MDRHAGIYQGGMSLVYISADADSCRPDVALVPSEAVESASAALHTGNGVCPQGLLHSLNTSMGVYSCKNAREEEVPQQQAAV